MCELIERNWVRFAVVVGILRPARQGRSACFPIARQKAFRDGMVRQEAIRKKSETTLFSTRSEPVWQSLLVCRKPQLPGKPPLQSLVRSSALALCSGRRPEARSADPVY